MTDFAPSPAAAIEQRIRANRLLPIGAPWADEIVFPHFGGLSILNLTHTIAELLGAPLPGSRPLDPAVWGGQFPEGIQRVVLILSDGLGYRWLQQLMAQDDAVRAHVEALSDGRGPVPLTSVVPSTTATALSTFWTGVSAAAHGMTGFSVYLRDLDMLTTPLFFKPLTGKLQRDSLVRDFGIDPMRFLPVRGFAERLAERGVPTYVLQRLEYAGSALSAVLHRGIPDDRIRLHTGHFDKWLRLRDLLAATRGQRCYIHAYLPAVDAVSHGYGAQSPEAAYTIRRQLAELAAVLTAGEVQDGRTLFLVTADHGHYDAPANINLFAEPSPTPLADFLRGRPSGEARFSYVFVRDGKRQQVTDLLLRHFRDRIAWVDSEAALEAGLFGPEPPYREVRHRIGDLILMPRQGIRLEQGIPPMLVGVHGGLSDWEMLVPLLWSRS
ncbi:MAG: alkaline phosphatase family protein [Anaerolineae bacterium]